MRNPNFMLGFISFGVCFFVKRKHGTRKGNKKEWNKKFQFLYFAEMCIQLLLCRPPPSSSLQHHGTVVGETVCADSGDRNVYALDASISAESQL